MKTYGKTLLFFLQFVILLINVKDDIFTMKTEILAPAGDKASFFAAVNAGADAVYLGLNSFNARMKADNFTNENISEIISYAHLFGVKVYVTVNTLIKTEEITEFLNTIDICMDAKADAFIVQDLGMATLIRERYPKVCLHASTQMGVNNYHAAKALKDLGFTRVVLSRETSVEDLKKIIALDIETEFFVQGALCVSFSGNCYISSIKCGASGNRGLCRQLCRLKYHSQKKDGYLLSASDLCLAKNIPYLCSLGVTSLKIEGRLKRPSYVATAVKLYKTAVEQYDETTINGLIDTLSKISSRGKYNETAYLFDRDNIINTKVNDYSGEKIGITREVKKIKNIYRVFIETKEKINVGDGLNIGGTTLGIGNAEKSIGGYFIYTIRPIKENSVVFRTLDKAFEDNVMPTERKIKIDCKIEAIIGKPLEMTFSTSDISVTACGDVCVKADKAPLDENSFRDAIKFGKENFVLDNFSLNTNGVFIPRSILNSIRREATSKLKTAIIENNSPSKEIQKNSVATVSFDCELPTNNYIIIDETTDFEVRYNEKIIISPNDYSKENIKKIVEKVTKKGYTDTIFINLPTVANGDETDYLHNLISSLKNKWGKIGIVANNYYGFSFLPLCDCIAGTGLNVFNDITMSKLISLGFTDCFSSIEEAKTSGVIYIGNPALMTMVHCPYKTTNNSSCTHCNYDGKLEYKDERGNAYIITRYKIRNCYFEMRFKNKGEYSTLVKNQGKRYVKDLRQPIE